MRYRVHFEASAAIGIEIEVEAEDEDAAQAQAERLIEGGVRLDDIVGELLVPAKEAVRGYAQASGLPLVHVSVETDENGFEAVDVFEPLAGEG